MIIATQRLRKEYDDVVAVNNVDLEIPEGEIFALIGPNGAGKTTLMRLISGLLEPTDGSAFIAGIDVWKDNLDANAYMAFLPDFFGCYGSLKVWEYLDYFAHAYRMPEETIPGRIDTVLAQVSLTEKRDAFVKGLSRGMQQRLGIAKCLIHDPKLLILDEPASGLDPLARQQLAQILVDLRAAGKTILVSSHILSELRDFATYVGIMARGRIVRSGRITDLVVQEGMSTLVMVEVLKNPKKLLPMLQKVSTIREVRLASPSVVEFLFAGTDEELVALHAHLVQSGFPIVGFSRKQADIQDIFTEVAEKEGARDA